MGGPDRRHARRALPAGAAITEDAGDGVFKGEFKVKIGPTTAAYNGALKMEDLDAQHRVATMSAKGTDKRGNGGATATIVSSVEDAGGGETRVDVATDFTITGKLARFGRGGMIQDVSNRLLREFAANLQEDLAGAPQPEPEPEPGPQPGSDAPQPPSPPAPSPPRPAAEPLDGGGLVLGVVGDRLRTAAAPLLVGFALGVIAARRFTVHRR